MKIVVIHSGADHEVFPLMSLLIGLEKKYKQTKVTWIGDPHFFDLVRFNKRVHKCIPLAETSSLDRLKLFFGPDLLVNPSRDKASAKIASLSGAKSFCGFGISGPVDRNAEFFSKVVSGNLRTNRHILDLYYSLADLKWQGEGYGLSYYPRTKQNKDTGIHLSNEKNFAMPAKLLGKIDAINEYSQIVTDDLFICHTAIALRKLVLFADDSLSYRLCFFGRGSQQKGHAEDLTRQTEFPQDY